MRRLIVQILLKFFLHFFFNRGQTSSNSNVVKCQEDGNWDFGDLRCEGPVCEDPRRPPDGIQISESYEQGSEVKFECNKEGYIPINPAPITCTEAQDCKIIAPLGITSGVIPDSGMFGVLFWIMHPTT